MIPRVGSAYSTTPRPCEHRRGNKLTLSPESRFTLESPDSLGFRGTGVPHSPFSISCAQWCPEGPRPPWKAYIRPHTCYCALQVALVSCICHIISRIESRTVYSVCFFVSKLPFCLPSWTTQCPILNPEQNVGKLLLPVMIVEQEKFAVMGYNPVCSLRWVRTECDPC